MTEPRSRRKSLGCQALTTRSRVRAIPATTVSLGLPPTRLASGLPPSLVAGSTGPRESRLCQVCPASWLHTLSSVMSAANRLASNQGSRRSPSLLTSLESRATPRASSAQVNGRASLATMSTLSMKIWMSLAGTSTASRGCTCAAEYPKAVRAPEILSRTRQVVRTSGSPPGRDVRLVSTVGESRRQAPPRWPQLERTQSSPGTRGHAGSGAGRGRVVPGTTVSRTVSPTRQI